MTDLERDLELKAAAKVQAAETSREQLRSQLIGALWGNFQLQKLIGYERPNQGEVNRVLEAMVDRMKTGNGMGF